MVGAALGDCLDWPLSSARGSVGEEARAASRFQSSIELTDGRGGFNELRVSILDNVGLSSRGRKGDNPTERDWEFSVAGMARVLFLRLEED